MVFLQIQENNHLLQSSILKVMKFEVNPRDYLQIFYLILTRDELYEIYLLSIFMQ